MGLVIDLGGVHNPMDGTVALKDLNLTKRAAYDLDFFFAERRCCGSNFRLETSIKPVTSECVIWGDPHISAFDHTVVVNQQAAMFNSIYSDGDYWLVKNSLVWIQGRYGPTQWTTAGQSALLALAVGGPFLQQGGKNHTLIIEPRDDGHVTWDGEPIVQELPSEFSLPGFVGVTHKLGQTHIDQGLKHFPVHMVHVRLPRMVALTVNRWRKHIDAIIRSPQQIRGQDGHCGNFNLNAEDDTQERIAERIGAPLPEESLFSSPGGASVGGGGVLSSRGNLPENGLERCEADERKNAQNARELAFSKKRYVLPPDSRDRVLNACVIDVCLGGLDFAEEDAVTEIEAVETEMKSLD